MTKNQDQQQKAQKLCPNLMEKSIYQAKVVNDVIFYKPCFCNIFKVQWPLYAIFSDGRQSLVQGYHVFAVLLKSENFRPVSVCFMVLQQTILGKLSKNYLADYLR